MHSIHDKKPKKFNVKKAKKHLDTCWSIYIRRLYPTCQKCGKTGSTQAAHIFSRGHLSTRWDTTNGIGLCFYCHLYWAHREPVEFTLWIIRRMGKKEFDALKARAKKIYDPSNLPKDYERLKKELGG